MTNDRDFAVHFTQQNDGSWLAASVSSPWFCVSADTEVLVRKKAQAALDFWAENHGRRIQASLERTVAPFASQHVETLRSPGLALA